MANFKKGDAVRQIMPAPIEGIVTGFEIDQESGEVQLLVEWQDGSETRRRHFAQGQVEAFTSE